MTIKDAEKLTGLTAKSIRYYEGKGLIEVKRDAQNAYRNYTEEDIHQLKLIKLLRYLGFGVEEIKPMMGQTNVELHETLMQKAQQLERESDTSLEKRDMCHALARDCRKELFAKKMDEYSESIDFLESEEGDTLRKGLRDIFCPNLSVVILQTLVCGAPIVWLFEQRHICNRNGSDSPYAAAPLWHSLFLWGCRTD